jgi:hypothetical protein
MSHDLKWYIIYVSWIQFSLFVLANIVSPHAEVHKVLLIWLQQPTTTKAFSPKQVGVG